MQDFLGNQQIIQLFCKLPKEALSHAYLFSGREGLGKRTFALKLIQSLQCPQGKILKPCLKCPACLQITHNSHPDTIILKGEEKISINEVRKIQRKINLKSQQSPLKICLIDNAERLTKEAQNAILKILEEPPQNSLFILITAKPKLLSATIRSRCQNIPFRPLKKSALKAEIAKIFPALQITETILNYADGAPGKAIRFLNDSEFSSEFKEQQKIFQKFSTASLTERFQINNQLSQKTLQEIQTLLENWLFYTDLELKTGTNQSQQWSKLAETLLEIKQKTAYNLNKRILLDQLALKGPRIQ